MNKVYVFCIFFYPNAACTHSRGIRCSPALGFGPSDARVSGRTVEITHLLSLPLEKKKATTLGFGFSGFSMFFGLRRKFLGRMTKSSVVVVVETAAKDGAAEAPPAEQLERAIGQCRRWGRRLEKKKKMLRLVWRCGARAWGGGVGGGTRGKSEP